MSLPNNHLVKYRSHIYKNIEKFVDDLNKEMHQLLIKRTQELQTQIDKRFLEQYFNDYDNSEVLSDNNDS